MMRIAVLEAFDGLTIREGSRGAEVERAKQRLAVHGWPVGPGDLFDALMTTAVEAFQDTKGLRQDGIIGPLTWSALEAEPSGDVGPFLPDVGDRVVGLSTGAKIALFVGAVGLAMFASKGGRA